VIAGPIASRLGPRSLAASDARFKLDRIHQSEVGGETRGSGSYVLWTPDYG
jgi:hypothetical protein